MRKLGRLTKRRDLPIQIPQPLMQIRVIRSNCPEIRLEVLHVDDVEADDGCVEADVGFGYGSAKVEGAFFGGGAQVLLCAVERFEEGSDGFFVGFLGSGKAGFVDAVVDVVVGPVVRLFDLLLQTCGEQFYFLVLFRK